MRAIKRTGLTPPQVLVIGFAIIIVIGACLLTLPAAAADGVPLSFLDALFTATSATCVTGLVVVDTGARFSVFGQMIILAMIQVGGLGFMSMATLAALVFKRRISLKERLILQEAMNQGNMEGIVRLIRRVLLYSLTIEFIGFVLFSIRWSFDLGLARGLYFGLFHSISLFNNAGFDVFGSVTGPFSSLTAYAGDPLVNITAMGLIVLGGLGFIVMSDVMDYRKNRRLSLHSKVVLSMTGWLVLIGAVVLLVFEYSNPKTLGALDGAGKLWASFFQSVAPRTAGPNTLDIAGLRQASQFFIIILMFIGASPGSTGGGIKTTTFATLIGAIVAMIRGKEDIVLFRHRLGKDRILKAITLTMIALFLVVFVTMALTMTEESPFLDILFEVTSAFGTVGLSMGLTPHLSDIGKLMIALTMFAGRLGPITLAFALGPKPERELYRYPEGKITIG